MNYLQTFCSNIISSTKTLVLIPVLALSYSCDDVLEEDITNDLITVVAPLDGTTVSGNSVQFLWNTLDGADDYAVQIYNGGFVVVDSVVAAPPFVINLNSDSYQWRVKGQNFAYETSFSFPQEFEVVSSDDLTNVQLNLNSPSAEFYTNQQSIIFSWQTVANATRYSFELIKVSSGGEVTVFVQDDLTDTTLTLGDDVLTEDAPYRWQVKAVNDDNTTETAFSSRNLFIDTVVPNLPNLLTPTFEEEFLIDTPIAFTWNFGTDSGVVTSAITSVYEVARDASFTTVVVSGSTELTSFGEAFSQAGTYFWRVRGEDQAGNIGTYNLNGKFIVNE